MRIFIPARAVKDRRDIGRLLPFLLGFVQLRRHRRKGSAREYVLQFGKAVSRRHAGMTGIGKPAAVERLFPRGSLVHDRPAKYGSTRGDHCLIEGR